MSLSSNQAFYLLIDDKGIASMSMTLGKYFKIIVKYRLNIQ